MTWTTSQASYPVHLTGELDPNLSPANFDVAYPERLSRGLVLVKWLVAVPHLIAISGHSRS